MIKNEISHELTPNETKMGTQNMKKLILTYSIPTVLSMFINALYNVVDRFWVGQIPGVGATALTGVGVTMPLMLIGLGFAMLVGLGAATRISIALGQRDKDQAERILGNSFTLSILIAICLTIIGYVFLDKILFLAGASAATLPYAYDYFSIILFGMIFQLLSFAMNHPIRASGNPKRFAMTQLVGALTNMILDPILIIYFDMGVKGAAIATIFSMFVSTVFVFLYYFKKDSTLNLHAKYFKLQLPVVLSIVSIGFAPFLMQIAASVIGVIINILLRTFGDASMGNGDVAIGAMTIIQGIQSLVLMPIFGINQGAQPIIGYNYGAGNYKRVKEAYKWNVIYAMSVSFVGFVLVELFAVEVVSAFIKDPHLSSELVRIGSRGLRIVMTSAVLVAIQAPSVNMLTSIGYTKISIVLSMLRQILFLLPLYVLLPTLFGFDAIWFAQPTSDVLATIVTSYFIINVLKKLKITMAERNANLSATKQESSKPEVQS